jgi:NAD(P)-dependent dehydrogenase (short-subunit alcohol dehydrogenase family)
MKTEIFKELLTLDGKVALVTDSGSLASVDVAPMLADAGAQVVIADKDPAAAKLADEIVARGGKAAAIPVDIESEFSVLSLFKSLREKFGRLDILVNCAGVNGNQPFTEATLQQFDEVNSVNLRSVFMLMREGVKAMLEGGAGGRIVNITTMGSLHPVLNGNEAYSATRAGVTMMTRSVAMDYARDRILANVVLPGAVMGKTRFHPATLEALQGGHQLSGPGSDTDRRLPLGYGNGRDIAMAVLYLVGPSSGYITGQSLVLDGGFLSS